jgi:HSP20 family protein
MEKIHMAITPSSFTFGTLGSEIDALFAEMEARASGLMSRAGSPALTEKVKNTGMTVFGSSFHVDVCEQEHAIIVTTDLPGVDKKDISVRLLNPQTLLIRTDVCTESDDADDAGTYHIRERKTGSMQRSIHLPAPVMGEGAKAGFKNGVMEITLQKDSADPGIPIKIQ